MRMHNRAGALIRFIRDGSMPRIRVHDVTSKLGISEDILRKLEYQAEILPEDFLHNFSQAFGFPNTYLVILNKANNFSDDKQAFWLYKLFKFVRGQQNPATDINRVLSLMRLVSGYNKPREFAKELSIAYEDNFGLSARLKNKMDSEVITHLESIEIPTKEQLLFYASFFKVRIDMLTFWTNPDVLKNASDKQKEKNLYILFSAARDIYCNSLTNRKK